MATTKSASRTAAGTTDAGAEPGTPGAEPGTPAADGVVTLLWTDHGAATPARRGPKPKLTVAQIADAGIAIADDDGLDAVTMQRVAERLGATKMALYRYVPGRGELDALMLDRGLGAPSPAPPGDWRSSLANWANELFERASAHAWAVELAQRTHTPGPQEMLWFEVGLAALADLPLTAGEQLDVLAALSDHVMSLVRRGAASQSPESDLAEAIAPVLAARHEEYPLTSAAFAQVPDDERDRGLWFGIDRLIDGVEALVQRRLAEAWQMAADLRDK